LKRGKHLVLKGTANGIPVRSLLDNGSEADLIDLNYVRKHKIPTFKLKSPIPLFLADGTKLQDLEEAALIEFHMGEHHEQWLFYVLQLAEYQMIIGDNWLQEHNPQVDWIHRSLTFNSSNCFEKGCLSRGRTYTEYTGKHKLATEDEKDLDIQMIGAKTFFRLARKRDHHGFLLLPRDDKKYICAATANAVTSADYDQFMKGKPVYTKEELLARIPKEYHDFVDVFMKQDADKLPPHRPEDHTIRLIEGATPPFARKYRPMSIQEQEAVRKYIQEQLGKGFIRRGSSPAAAPVLLVRKPGGGIRVCVDYRELNNITIKNRYPIPLIAETLDRLAGAKIFSKFDVVAAFNQIRMKEGHEWLTAFNTRYGQFEYLVMPFGLCNAPGTFQSYINETVRDYLDVFCTAYLDDILVFSEKEEEHTEHVRKLLQRLRERGLQLDIDKCEFGVRETKYLGVIITTEGIKMDPEKVQTILDWEIPTCVQEVKSFVGFAGFYRRFIKAFSRLTKPLSELTRGELFLTKSGRRKFKYRDFKWTKECQEAFDNLKRAFTTAPILAHFDPTRETWVETDASNGVVAGVLSQMVNGELRPVAFFSKKLAPPECKYMIHDKELLAIIQAFKLWRPELMGVDSPIKVYSDHLALEYFMTTKVLNGRQVRWAEFLSEFNFKIMYRPGAAGGKPDALSRRSQDLPGPTDLERRGKKEDVLLKGSYLDGELKKFLSLQILENEGKYVNEISGQPEDDLGGDSDQPEEEECEDNLRDLDTAFATAYEKDKVVQDIITAKENNLRRLPKHILSKGIKLSMSDLEVKDGRLWVSGRIYVPEDIELRHTILELYHKPTASGHPGPRRMHSNLIRGYFWPGMRQDVMQYANFCPSCHRAKAKSIKKQGLLQPLPVPQHRWMDITMDFIVDLPVCTRRGRQHRHLMVVVDRLSKEFRAEPLTSLEVEEVFDAMNRRVFSQGLPCSIVSDRGSQFVSHLWKRICQRRGVKIKLSSAQHPETDGQTEIYNKLVKNYLRHYIDYLQDDWLDYLPDAELAGNSATHSAIGMSAFFANHGYHPRTGFEPPGTYEGRGKAEIEHADKIVARTEEIREHLREHIAWAQSEYQEQADKNRQPHPQYRIGDLVYVDARHFAGERPSKSLGSKNMGPWKITRVINDKAYEVELPEDLKRANVTPIFHPWKLHLAPRNPFPGQHPDPQPPVILTNDEEDEHEEWEVLDVVDCRETKRYGVQYKARFMGNWDDWNANPSWQPWTDLKNAVDKVLDFHKKHPEKPKPPEFFLEERC